MVDVLVVGAGIIGLTCAVRLREAGARVAVLAADPPAATTSAVAAAVWYPTRTQLSHIMGISVLRSVTLVVALTSSAAGQQSRPTFRFEEAMGYAPEQVGLLLLPFPLTMLVVSPLAGWMKRKRRACRNIRSKRTAGTACPRASALFRAKSPYFGSPTTTCPASAR